MTANQAQVIAIARTIDAPRALAFKAWIEPAHILHWYYASEGWTTPYAETDPRPGGAFRIGFGSPDGKNDFAFEGVYKTLSAPQKLVFTIADGRPVTVHFAEAAGKTRITIDLTLETLHSEQQQREGWGAMLDHLGQYLAKYLSGAPSSRK